MKMTSDDYLQQLPRADHQAINGLRDVNRRLLHSDKKGVRRYADPCESVSHLRAQELDLSGDIVRIGTEDELKPGDHDRLERALRSFMPWRKGPLRIFGIDIDAEWRSERKWRRVLPFLPDLRDKIIADIGCNNGYYMFLLAHHQPRLVLGLDPVLQHYFTFKTLNQLAGIDTLSYELMGVEHLPLFPACFELIFLMGVIYHRSNPIEVLRDVRTALAPGGMAIIESQAIPGDSETALFPENRYAKAPGIYFVPTARCLANWMRRAGFQRVEICASHPMTSQDQRRTDWMTFESYADFIHPDDPNTTVEGYPAPIRVILRGMIE